MARLPFIAVVMVLSVVPACTAPPAAAPAEPPAPPAPPAPAVAPAPRETLVAEYAAVPVALDGRLDEPMWERATAYPLQTPGGDPREGGTLRLAWDAEHLYAAFEFEDADVVQEDDRDDRPHYETGDVAELFVKPADASWYWEFYATPQGRRTVHFYPGRGRRGLPGNLTPGTAARVAAEVDGTLNQWRDRDRGWTAELAVPRAMLTEGGVELAPGTPWRVLAGRYNFGRELPAPELSVRPRLEPIDFHRLHEWADLLLEPPGRE